MYGTVQCPHFSAIHRDHYIKSDTLCSAPIDARACAHDEIVLIVVVKTKYGVIGMRSQYFHLQILVAIASMAFCIASFSDQPSHSPAAMNMSPDGQKDMASMYRKMADCLDTGSSPHDCMQTAMKDCPVMAKTGHCPIVEGMGSSMSSGHPMDMSPDHQMKMSQ